MSSHFQPLIPVQILSRSLRWLRLTSVWTSSSNKTLAISGLFTGIGAYVAVDEVRNETVLSIRGSSNIRNWITNVVVLFRDCSFTTDCKVHAGFATAWDEIASEAVTAILDAHKKNPNYKIVLTGHSLGGAVATIAAATLRKAGVPLELYTYGSPRVGNDKFATWFSEQQGGHWRVTHGNDAVPRLPSISFGYRHTTPEYWLPGFWLYPWRTDYTAGEVQVCHGIANNQCNGQNTLFHSIVAHLHYLGSTASCVSPLIGMRDTSETEELSEEVQDQLIKLALEDEKYLREHDL